VGIPVNVRIDQYTAAVVIAIRAQGVSAEVGREPGVVLTKASNVFSESYRVYIERVGPRQDYIETCRPAQF
jgi:hypothetical protein